MKPLYLASPYSHVDAQVRAERFQEAVDAAAFLMRRGQVVYSPIVHNHPLAVAHDLPTGWDYWKRFDEAMLACCGQVFVLMIEGWHASHGIAAEVAIAKNLSLPVGFLFKSETGYDEVFVWP